MWRPNLPGHVAQGRAALRGQCPFGLCLIQGGHRPHRPAAGGAYAGLHAALRAAKNDASHRRRAHPGAVGANNTSCTAILD